MDDLDRLYLELVEVLRTARSASLTEPCTVSELHDRLIPYARVRDRAALRSNGDYEAALCRLLSGEREYLRTASQDMQSELRKGLEATLPDVRRYRSFPDVRVWLNPERIPPPGDTRYAPPEIQDRALRDAERQEQPETGEEPESAAEQPDDRVPSEEEIESDDGGVTVTEEPVCSSCGAVLPGGSALYCPYCGVGLAGEVCEECGRELEPDWRFCPECGASRGGD